MKKVEKPFKVLFNFKTISCTCLSSHSFSSLKLMNIFLASFYRAHLKLKLHNKNSNLISEEICSFIIFRVEHKTYNLTTNVLKDLVRSIYYSDQVLIISFDPSSQ